MPELDFLVKRVDAVRYAAVPMLNFKLHIANTTPGNAIAGHDIANVMLQCQIQIEAQRRRYQPAELDRLGDLFGDPNHSGQGPRLLLWTHVSLLVPGFQNSVVADMPVPCSYDFNVAAVKYFDALEGGEVPLSFQFSGSIFYRDDNADLQISRIAWSKEARFALPVAVWRQMIDHYYPNINWLQLERGVFDRLSDYRRQRGLASCEQALESLLAATGEHVR